MYAYASMPMHTYACIHAYACICMHAYVCSHMHAYACIHMLHTHACKRMHTYASMHMHTCMHASMHTHAYARVCMHACTSMHMHGMHIHTYISMHVPAEFEREVSVAETLKHDLWSPCLGIASMEFSWSPYAAQATYEYLDEQHTLLDPNSRFPGKCPSVVLDRELSSPRAPTFTSPTLA